MKREVIFGVETSCDETALALVEARGGQEVLYGKSAKPPTFKIIKSLVASQIKIHAPYGGVVPNLAKREHLKNLPMLLNKLLNQTPSLLDTVGLIAVTVGPGLEPALWTGINFAKELYKKLKLRNPDIKLVGANHLEGHLFSFLLPSQKKTALSQSESPISKIFPAAALIVSGGHTILIKMDSLAKWKKLGETRDDAAGEAFDKVARLLGLQYPGGSELERLAKRGNPDAIHFTRPMMYERSYDFSFSGLKTAVLYYLRDHPLSAHRFTLKADIAASFQKAAVEVLVYKTMRAVKEYSVKSVMLSGGVAANKVLRRDLRNATRMYKLNFFVPDFIYNTDNAAMIAVAGYLRYLQNKNYRLAAKGNLNI